MANKKKPRTLKSIKNKRAEFEYFLVQKYEAGIMLTGTEIKSVREGNVVIKDAFCFMSNGELWIRNMHIAPYKFGTYSNHDPIRERKLLLTKRELKKIDSKLKEKGLTMVAVEMYINDRGYAKIDVALAKGKKFFDKRQTLKNKENKREIDRQMKNF